MMLKPSDVITLEGQGPYEICIWKTNSQHHDKWIITQCFQLRSGTKHGGSPSSFLINIIL